MIRLNQTASQFLQLITGQNGAVVDVSYSDKTATDFAGDSILTSITAAATTTICPTPAAGAVRYIDYISITNTFAGNNVITVQVNSGAAAFPLVQTLTLAQGDRIEYTHGAGWTGRPLTVRSDAAFITNTPAGNIAATTVQAALNELDAEKATVGSAIGYKNKIFGGDFTTNPWQRGTSFAAITGGVYYADRWKYRQTVATAVVTASKAADAPTATQAGIFTQHCLSLAVTTIDAVVDAGDRYSISQSIEGLNVASFGFGQAGSRNVTLSFWVKGTKTGIHCVSLRNSAADRSYVAEYTIVTTNTWEYKTVTIPVDTTGTWLYGTEIGVGVDFTLAAGTTFQTTANTWAAGDFYATANQVNALDTIGNDFKIALVQLEAGSVATAFDVRDVGTELSLCERYCEHNYLVVQGASYSTYFPKVDYRVQKRAVPTVTLSAGTMVVNATTFGFYQNGAHSGGAALAVTSISDCEL